MTWLAVGERRLTFSVSLPSVRFKTKKERKRDRARAAVRLEHLNGRKLPREDGNYFGNQSIEIMAAIRHAEWDALDRLPRKQRKLWSGVVG